LIQSAAWYDRFYATKDYAAEARQVTALIHQHNPPARTLLDVACGTGRHLEHLRETFACHGVDLDPALLEFARQRLPGIPLTHGDMTDFDLGRRFDAVTCLFSSIGYTRTTGWPPAVAAMRSRPCECTTPLPPTARSPPPTSITNSACSAGRPT
jgi:SAM-dependent methyltransferase